MPKNSEGAGAFQTVYVVTMWSGGKPGKRWKTLGRPKLLPNGAGVSFISLNTRLSVHVIGNVSVEEFEQGHEYDEYKTEVEEPEQTDEAHDAGGSASQPEVMI